MDKQIIIINGDNISNLETFYNETDRVLTKDMEWPTGHNLNAFNDLLRGGFGVFEYQDPIKLIWTNFSSSKKYLEQEMIDILEDIIGRHEHIEFIAID